MSTRSRFPVYWEHLEPQEGHFDFTVVDTILAQAREHKLHVVFLWFATWKNGRRHYIPQWMKLQPQRYPNMIGPDGKYVDSPSPFAAETLAADANAFSIFMSHLKEADPNHTVVMVQVENEPGAWQCPRDYSPVAQKIFESPVPAEVLAAMQKPAQPNSNWTEVFGHEAEIYFHSWFVVRYIGQVAAAGKAAYPLPLYCNASVRDPDHAARSLRIWRADRQCFPALESRRPRDRCALAQIYNCATPRDISSCSIFIIVRTIRCSCRRQSGRAR